MTRPAPVAPSRACVIDELLEKVGTEAANEVVTLSRSLGLRRSLTTVGRIEARKAKYERWGETVERMRSMTEREFMAVHGDAPVTHASVRALVERESEDDATTHND